VYVDWQQVATHDRAAPAVVDSRRRMAVLAALFFVGLAAVFVRIVQLEACYGAAFRDEAAQPLSRRVSLPAVRGRILSSDGVVLACDRELPALAVHYRWLEEPPDPAWLKQLARARLPAGQRTSAALAQSQQQVLADRAAIRTRLCSLCGVDESQFRRRAQQVQVRVERIVASVNRRRFEALAESDESRDDASADEAWDRRLARWLKSTAPPATTRIIVAEQRQYHVMAEDVPLDAAAEIQAHPEQYPGARIVLRPKRHYPEASMAAHVLGYVRQNPSADGGAGQAGAERRFDRLLAAADGVAVELTDHGGKLLRSYRQTEPGVGRDLVLTLDARLQRAAEAMLDEAIARRKLVADRQASGGGAIVALDVESGAVLAIASAPRFEPGWFAGSDDDTLRRALVDPEAPFVHRAASMALAPGSVFKLIDAAALMSDANFAPNETLDCRGYLNDPEHWRCAIFARHHKGHGSVTLIDALAQSCNVYFFEQARHLGGAPLCDWARRFGLGAKTGFDLEEASGTIPDPAARDRSNPWFLSDTLATAIGQGTVTATPLQIVRLAAAVANGGKLVRPHVVAQRSMDEASGEQSPTPIAGLGPRHLAPVQEGMQQAVRDAAGTAHDYLSGCSVRVAAKTGTAQTGRTRPDHAWITGYLPADAPRVAFVVVLEYGGDAGPAAGPVARRLVEKLVELGLVR